MFQPAYTVSDLDAQLKHARAAMRLAGTPDLRLTRTCDDDSALRRMIENRDPFNQPYRVLYMRADHVQSFLDHHGY